MPVIQSPQQPSTETFPRVARWVEVKQNWADPWLPIAFWVPLRARIEVAPGHGGASFGRWLGRVQPEGSTTKQLFTPADLVDWYCRIIICHPAQQPVPIWTGIIPDSTVLVDSPTVGRAQTLEAFGLTWLMDRQPLTRSWVRSNGATVLSEDLLIFNRRNPGKGLSLSGNRSKDKDLTLGCYVFEGGVDGCREWSNLDIAEYLLKTQVFSEVEFSIGGMTAAIATMKNEWKQAGTVWQMLNQLIDKRHGLTFYPKVGDDGKVTLWITSEIETDINYGGQTLPKNPVQVSFALPTTGAEQHLPLDITCRFTEVAKYDQLVIRGNFTIIMATLSKLDGSFDRGWTAGQSSDYRFSGSMTAEEADDARKKWEFTDVFTKFVVPPTWDGKVKNGDGAGAARNVFPITNEDGTFDFSFPGPFLREFRQLNRELIIEKGKLYQTSPITDSTEPGSEPEFRPILVAIKDSFDGAGHKATNKWIRADRLGSSQSGLHNLNVSVLDKDMGIRITCHPHHYLAGNEWDAMDATTVWPEIDWTQLLITACFTTDVRQEIVITLAESGENAKKKIIDVPAAEHWRIIPETVVDIDNDGALVRVHADNLVVRDDIEILKAYAAFAQTWYGTQRQAVTIPIQTLGQFVELGTYLTGISNAYMWLPVGTVVTGIEWDFAAPTTTISTGHGGDDMFIEPVEFIGKAVGRGRARGR